MEFIAFHKGSIDYPVGIRIHRNIEVIKHMADHISSFITNADTVSLWCRGSSGAIIAVLVSAEIQDMCSEVFINHVKKDGEVSHSGCDYHSTAEVNIVIDDFIESGDTIHSIIDEIENEGIRFISIVVSKSVSSKLLAEFEERINIESLICKNIICVNGQIIDFDTEIDYELLSELNTEKEVIF